LYDWREALVGRVRAQGGANIDSNHILVVKALRAKICRAYMTRQYQQRRRFAVERLKFEDVVTQFQSADDVQTHSLTELWNVTEEKIKKVATITVGYAQYKRKKRVP
jgi:hypothetical protein